MFKKSEIEQIDKKYFQILQSTCYHITLKSRNTKHIWDIYCRDGNGYRSLIVSHKHKETDPFHEQIMHPRTVTEAQELIKNHDVFQLKGRK